GCCVLVTPSRLEKYQPELSVEWAIGEPERGVSRGATGRLDAKSLEDRSAVPHQSGSRRWSGERGRRCAEQQHGCHHQCDEVPRGQQSPILPCWSYSTFVHESGQGRTRSGGGTRWQAEKDG